MKRERRGPKSVFFVLFALIFSSLFGVVSSDSIDENNLKNVEKISPELIEILPHDPLAFTQGLAYFNGQIYESTGLYGESSLRVVNTTTGAIEQITNLSDQYFAEGISILNNSIIQLTWRENIGFIYNISTLEKVGEFSINGEGWGLCTTGEGNIWLSDGSFQLSKVNPNNLSSIIDTLTIYYNGSPINRLNELECPNNSGLIYSNIWLEDRILSINSSTGDVCMEYDFSNIRLQYENNNSKELNGIAYVGESSLFWVTGKNWSNYYLVELPGDSDQCNVLEKSDDCCDDDVFSPFRMIIIIIIGIFIMPFSWPIFGMIFYKIFKRQTQHPPPTRNKRDLPEE